MRVRSRLLLGLVALLGACGARAQCNPGPNQASFTVDANYLGACSIRGIGDYPTAASTGLPNDSISAIRVGPGVQVYACRDEYFGGMCVVITQNVPNLTYNPIGNDQISSFKVQPAGAPPPCVPGPNQVSLYVDAGYAGACQVHGIGDYPTAASLGLPNDSISSIRIGPGAQTYVCRDVYYGGICMLVTADVANLTGTSVGNDQISSAKVQTAGSSTSCPVTAKQVAFFVDANFSDACQVRDFGNYPTADAIGLPNDSISSIRVGSGAQAVVCRDVSYGGDCQVFTSNVTTMVGTRVGNDQVSSAKVQPLGTQECSPGPSQAAFFMHANYVAPCSVRGIGAYPTADALGLPNDSISSILVGTGTWAVLCVDINYGNDCERFTGNVPFMGDTRIGNDTVSSGKVLRLGDFECNPGPTEVSAFMHADLVAPCSTRGIGAYRNAAAIGLPNDSISSLKVGSNAQAILCVDDNYLGDCQLFTGTVNFLGPTRIGNDTTSSMRVQPLGDKDCPLVTPAQVSLYMHADFLLPCVTKGVGDYPDSTAIGLPDKSISSVRVGSGVQLCACIDNNYGSACQTFTSDTSILAGPTVGNDTISSAKIQKLGSQCLAVVPTPPKSGYSQVQVFNCASTHDTVNIWMRNDTIGGSYVDQGTQASNWSSDGSCPVGSPKVITLKDGNIFEFVAVDPGSCGGQNNPTNLDCIKTTFSPVTGYDKGGALTLQVN